MFWHANALHGLEQKCGISATMSTLWLKFSRAIWDRWSSWRTRAVCSRPLSQQHRPSSWAEGEKLWSFLMPSWMKEDATVYTATAYGAQCVGRYYSWRWTCCLIASCLRTPLDMHTAGCRPDWDSDRQAQLGLQSFAVCLAWIVFPQIHSGSLVSLKHPSRFAQFVHKIVKELSGSQPGQQMCANIRIVCGILEWGPSLLIEVALHGIHLFLHSYFVDLHLNLLHCMSWNLFPCASSHNELHISLWSQKVGESTDRKSVV